MAKKLTRWLMVLYRPILMSLIIGLLLSSLAFQSQHDEQNVGRTAAVNEVLERLDKRTQDINDNSNRNTELLCKIFRQLFVQNNGDELSNTEVREIERTCREELERSRNGDPTPTPQDEAPSSSPPHNDPGNSPPEPENRNQNQNQGGGGNEEPDFNVPLVPEIVENVLGL